jgi:hypothetical protein
MLKWSGETFWSSFFDERTFWSKNDFLNLQARNQFTEEIPRASEGFSMSQADLRVLSR